jgi:hypothetical protein
MAPKWLFWPTPAGSDVTPDALDWSDQYSGGLSVDNSSPLQTIAGISGSINLSLSWVVVSGTFNVYYRINFGSFILCTTNPTTIAISSGQSLYFLLETGEYVVSSANFTVTNLSDGSAVLDTFTLSADGEPD